MCPCLGPPGRGITRHGTPITVRLASARASWATTAPTPPAAAVSSGVLAFSTAPSRRRGRSKRPSRAVSDVSGRAPPRRRRGRRACAEALSDPPRSRSGPVHSGPATPATLTRPASWRPSVSRPAGRCSVPPRHRAPRRSRADRHLRRRNLTHVPRRRCRNVPPRRGGPHAARPDALRLTGARAAMRRCAARRGAGPAGAPYAVHAADHWLHGRTGPGPGGCFDRLVGGVTRSDGTASGGVAWAAGFTPDRDTASPVRPAGIAPPGWAVPHQLLGRGGPRGRGIGSAPVAILEQNGRK